MGRPELAVDEDERQVGMNGQANGRQFEVAAVAFEVE